MGDAALDALFEGGFPRKPVEELRSSIQAAVEACLESDTPEGALPRALQLAERAIEQVDRQRRHLATIPELACHAGCRSCCFLRVEIGPAEAALLLPRVVELGLLEKVRATSEQVSELDRSARLRARTACALLSERGTCLVHDVRPFACRAANSLDERACEQHVMNADVAGAVPIDPVPFALQRAAAAGFRAACEAWGIAAHSGELHAMVVACHERGAEEP